MTQENLGISVLADGQTKMTLGPRTNHPESLTTLDSYARVKQTSVLFKPLYLRSLCYSSLACFSADTVGLRKHLLMIRQRWFPPLFQMLDLFPEQQ